MTNLGLIARHKTRVGSRFFLLLIGLGLGVGRWRARFTRFEFLFDSA